MFFFHVNAAPKLCTIYLWAYVCDFGRIHFVVMYGRNGLEAHVQGHENDRPTFEMQ